MKRIFFDNMIIDKIMARHGLLESIQKATQRGAFLLVTAKIIRDKLSETPDDQHREKLLATYDALPTQRVPTRGFILGISALGEGELVDDETAALLERLKTSGRGGRHDALIAATAEAKANVLVTEDRDLVTRAEAVNLNCEIWNFEKFARFIQAQNQIKARK